MLSEALRLIRVFHDLKQAELAGQLGLSRSYVSEIEKGKKTPAMDVIEKYSARFDIPVSSILFFAEQLSDTLGKRKPVDQAKGVIAGKIIDFLKFVERKTANDASNKA